MDKHDVAHYAIATVLAAAVVGINVDLAHQPKPVAIQHVDAAASAKPVPGAWPSLGQDKTVQIGEALKAPGPATVTSFCANPWCAAFRTDLDDAFQIGGWDDLEESSVIVGEETGLLVGPDGPKAQLLAPTSRPAPGLIGMTVTGSPAARNACVSARLP